MKPSKGSILITAIIGVLALIIIGGGVWYFIENKPTACTEEAKICPDGTVVGRTGKNCEFAECLTATLKPTTKYGIFGDDEFDTVVWGYGTLREEETPFGIGGKQTNVYFVIDKYMHEGFKNSLMDGIGTGNTVSREFGDKILFSLGCFDEKNRTIDSPGTTIDSETQKAIIDSSLDNLIAIKLSFNEHGGAGCACCNLAEEVSLYKEQ